MHEAFLVLATIYSGIRSPSRSSRLGRSGTNQRSALDIVGSRYPMARNVGCLELSSVAKRLCSMVHASISQTTSNRRGQPPRPQLFEYQGKKYQPGGSSHWKANYRDGMERLALAGRIHVARNSIQYVRYADDFGYQVRTNLWTDTGTGNFTDDKVYVVQTNTKVIERCILMATDPGDLVLDPTCGSGTAATVAEQWGRRWITIDTSRVALALARARIMGARYPFYLLADSREGQLKEAEVTGTTPSGQPTYTGTSVMASCMSACRTSHLNRSPTIRRSMSSSEQCQAKLEPLRESLNAALNTSWQEWEIPRNADASWPDQAKTLHAEWWQARIARQSEIDASIAAKAEFEFLYDKPYTDNKKVRVAGPFTVESLSPHRVLGVDENDELIDITKESLIGYEPELSFPQMILENLKIAGVQQAHKDDRITFTSLTPWPGALVCAEGHYLEGDVRKTGRDIHRAGVRDRPACGPRRICAGSGRCGFRCSDCMRLQLRSTHHRIHKARQTPGPQGAHECRPAHG